MKGLRGEIGCGGGKQRGAERGTRRDGRSAPSSGAPPHLEIGSVAARLCVDSAAAPSHLHPHASVSASLGRKKLERIFNPAASSFCTRVPNRIDLLFSFFFGGLST